MKKVTLFSFFNSYNIGDILIAKTTAGLFSEKFDCTLCNIVSGKECSGLNLDVSEFNISSNKGLKYKILYAPLIGDLIFSLKSKTSRVPNNALESSRTSELAIFAGGNSIMNLKLFPNEINVTYATIKALKEQGIRVAYCFCGVGPFKSKRSLRLAKKALELIDFISVRDNASYELVKSLVPEKEVEIWRDPVLLEKYDGACEESKTIGINVYFGADKRLHNSVKNGFVQLIKHLRENYSDYKIKLFSSELTDIDHILSVKAEFESDEAVFVENIKTTNQLFEMYKSVDVVLGTRMHTIITSMISKKAVISISWQAKVTSLVEYFENQDYNFELSYLISNPCEIAEKLMECLKNREEIINKNQEKLTNVRNETKEKFEKFILRM